MKSFKLIHQLLNMVEKLESEHAGQEVSMQDFVGYALSEMGGKVDGTPNSDVRFGNNEDEAQSIAYQLDNNIGRLFVFMSRYAKSYIKKVLHGTPLQTAEDFTCLAILLTHDNLSKSELINRNLLEKTSGTEVIRRLIQAELVYQWDDPDDKRGKRIAITTKGKQLLYVVFTDMNNVGKMITGKLTIAEKLTLQHLLQKLEGFHYEHFENKTILNKEDLKVVVEQL